MLNEIDLSRADLNLLTLFDVVLQERHVGRAADRLNLSPSAVSHGLRRLRRLLNDPLFVRTPKGVVPTDRAVELSAAIADVLARVRSVLASAEPFNPATSTRRFTIGAPDGVSAVFLPSLLARIRQAAPGIDIGLRQLLPEHGERSPDRFWRSAFSDLEARMMDIAIIPSNEIPARFHHRMLYAEDFVLAMSAGHWFAASPTLDCYCAAQHLVVSLSGDSYSFIDELLARDGLSRRVALTVPNFMFALAVAAETDFIAAVPREFAGVHAPRFGLTITEVPLPPATFRLNAIAPKAAMMDAGLSWLFDVLMRSGPADPYSELNA